MPFSDVGVDVLRRVVFASFNIGIVQGGIVVLVQHHGLFLLFFQERKQVTEERVSKNVETERSISRNGSV